MLLRHFFLYGLSIDESEALKLSTILAMRSIYASVASSASFTNKCADVWFIYSQLQYLLDGFFSLSIKRASPFLISLDNLGVKPTLSSISISIVILFLVPFNLLTYVFFIIIIISTLSLISLMSKWVWGHPLKHGQLTSGHNPQPKLFSSFSDH